MKKQLHILLADDDDDDRLFFAEAIDKLNIPNTLETVDTLADDLYQKGTHYYMLKSEFTQFREHLQYVLQLMNLPLLL